MTRKELIKNIQNDKKELKKQGYDLKRLYIVLNENIFKRECFTIENFPIVYSKDIDKPYCYKNREW